MFQLFRNIFVANFSLKLVSLLLAIVLWVVVLGSRTVEVTKEVPIEVVVGNDYVPVNDLPDRVTYRLAGPKAFLRTILDRKEAVIRINLASQKSGLMTYRFFSDHIRIPLGVKVVSIDPPVLPIRLEEVRKKEVPVRVSVIGELPAAHRLVKTTVVPPTIRIRGPEFRLATINEVYAKPIDVSRMNRTQIKDLQVDLSSFPFVRTDDSPPKVKFEIESPNQMFRIKSVGVNVRSDRTATPKDSSVMIYVRSTPAAMAELDRNEVEVTASVFGKGPGIYRVKPEVSLPPSFIFIKTVPSEIAVEIK